MRIAWIITGFAKDDTDMNGAPAIHNLAREISLHPDISLDIYSFYYPADKSTYRYFNANVYSFAKKENISKIAKLRIWKNAENKFAEEHSKEKYSIIHSLWSGESGNVASRLAERFKLPFITQVCGGEVAKIKEINFGNRLKYWQKLFTGRAFRKADKIIVGSDFLMELISNNYNKDISDKLVKIPFGVEQDKFHPDRKNNDNKKYSLINIANAVPVKNHSLLLGAFKLVLEKYPETGLVIIGKDNRNIIAKISNELNLNGSVRANGFIDYNLVPGKLNSSDVFVLSSYYEAQNVSALEAAFCGIPVVSTNTGIAPEISGNIAKDNSPSCLAVQIINVLDNLDSEKIKSKNKIEKLIRDYSLKSTTGKIVKLYESLLKG